MMRRLLLLAFATLSCTGLSSFAQADDWPGFRGATGGVAPDQDLPTKVGKDNVLWKVKMPGVGASSPIVVGDKLFLTAYAGYGTNVSKSSFGGGFGKGGFGKGDSGKGGFGKGGFGKGGPADPEQKKLKLLVVCVDRATGAVAWKKEIEPKLPEINFGGMIREHGYATPTPVSDGENVYAFFGKSGVVAFDKKGNELWRKDVGSSTHFMGTAASPLLYKNLLIVNASIESKSLIALDKKTGEQVWKAAGLGTAWASPVLVEVKGGKTEVVVSVPGKIIGYDAEKGTELWHCQGISSGGGGGGFGGFGGGYGGTSPSPVARDGVVYAMGGGGPSPQVSLAVKAGGSGDVTKTHVLWRKSLAGNYVSPVLVGDYLCWVDGTLQCLKTSNGASAFKERLYDGKGEYVSAVAAGAKVYALTRLNGLFVVDAASKFEKLDHFTFDGDDSPFNASPAVSDGRLYVRSNAYLYCIGKKS
ncbi:MAG: PQQ-binding-like beta-propeller repeat protein [Gemmataceae bacterium]